MRLLHHQCLWQRKYIANHLFFNKGVPAGLVFHNRAPPWLQLVAGHLVQVVFKVIFKCGHLSHVLHLFLSEPESDHWLLLSLTKSLTPCCLVNLFDVTLACKDNNSKLAEVVTVDVADSEKGVDNSLVQIWKLKFGHEIKCLSSLWAQGLVTILKLKLRQDFEV